MRAANAGTRSNENASLLVSPMTRNEKLLGRILSGRSDANVSITAKNFGDEPSAFTELDPVAAIAAK